MGSHDFMAFRSKIKPYNNLNQNHTYTIGNKIEKISRSSRNKVLMELIGESIDHANNYTKKMRSFAKRLQIRFEKRQKQKKRENGELKEVVKFIN
jgi:hypothetical protein